VRQVRHVQAVCSISKQQQQQQCKFQLAGLHGVYDMHGRHAMLKFQHTCTVFNL
jgi:hypothetical protein